MKTFTVSAFLQFALFTIALSLTTQGSAGALDTRANPVNIELFAAPDAPGNELIGNQAGLQFITAQCLDVKDCKSPCCAGPKGVCSGTAVGDQNGKTGCGFVNPLLPQWLTGGAVVQGKAGPRPFVQVLTATQAAAAAAMTCACT